MKKILFAFMLVGLAFAGSVRAEDSSTLVWCGLDYSKVKMIGTADFRVPEEIFPSMLIKWNDLFMTEMMPKLEKMAPGAASDLDAVEARNSKTSVSQVERKDGTTEEMVKPTHITDADIAGIVGSYKLSHTQGTGLVFIMDRLVKTQETGCLYVVFFDISSRKVLHSERMVEKAGGVGFRNFWFRPVKSALEKVPKMYKGISGKR